MSGFTARLLAAVLSLLGALLLFTLPYKLVPDRVLPTVSVRFAWPNTSELNVETLATSKIEGALAGLPDLHKTFSRSFPGRGEVFLEFDEGVGIEEKKVEVATLIKQMMPGLPAGIRYPQITGERPAGNDVRLLTYSMSSGSDTILWKQISSSLESYLRKIEGVKSIAWEGMPSPQLQIEISGEALRQKAILESDLVTAIQNELKSVSIGQVYTGVGHDERRYQATLQCSTTIEGLRDLVIGKVNGRIVSLREVANFSMQQQNVISTYRINGERTLGLSILAEPQANQIHLARQIHQVMDAFSMQFPNVHVQLIRDATAELREELQALGAQCLISFALLALVTILFYRDVHYLVVLFTSLGVTLLVSVISLKVLGISIHLYSMMALTLSVGFIIDNSLVAIDHFRKFRNKTIVIPIIAATVTNLTPLVVIFFLDDEARLNLVDFALCLTLTLSASLLVTFFVTPAITRTVRLQHTVKRKGHFRYVIHWSGRYRGMLLSIRKYRFLIGVVFVISFGFPFSLLPSKSNASNLLGQLYNRTLGSDFFISKIKPKAIIYLGGAIDRFTRVSAGGKFVDVPESPRVTLRMRAPFGSTLAYVDQICASFEHRLSLNKASGIDFFQTRIYDDRHAQIEVFCLAPADEALYTIKGFLEKEALSFSGLQITITGAGIPYSTNGGQVVDSHLYLTGYSYQELQQVAQVIKKELETTRRVQQVEVRSEPSWFAQDEQVFYASSSGVKPYSVLAHLYQQYHTIQVGAVAVGQEVVPVQLVPLATDRTLHSIMTTQFMIDDTTRFKPIYTTQVKTSLQSQSIVKDNQQYQLVVQYSFGGTPQQGKLFCSQVADRYNTQLPLGFSIRADELSGSDGADGKLYISLFIAIGGIFSICAILFESIRKAFVLVAIVPVTFIGVLYGLYFLELGFTQGTYAALILLAGLLVNTSIFVISEYTSQCLRTSRSRAYVRAIRSKFVSVLVTSSATVAGLIPFLTYESENEFWFPFAITTAIGTGLALLVILFVLPIYLIEKRP